MRCFIAIELPVAAKDQLRGLTDRLRPLSRGVRWVAVESLHLTLKFLGEAGDETVVEVSRVLTGVCAGHRPFDILLRGAGAFPGMRDPNVLWLGVEGPESLRELHRDVDRALGALGFEREERKFSPHLTLGRVKDTRGIEPVVKELATFRETVFGTIHVDHVVLMKSTLKPAGAEYSPITVCRLGAAL